MLIQENSYLIRNCNDGVKTIPETTLRYSYSKMNKIVIEIETAQYGSTMSLVVGPLPCRIIKNFVSERFVINQSEKLSDLRDI